MLETVKLALRITTDAFDAELTGLINAARKDLELADIDMIAQNEPLTTRAVILYCKAHFGDLPNAERFAKSYEMLKISLALAGDYRV